MKLDKRLKFDKYDYLLYIFLFTIIFDRTGLMIVSLEQKQQFGVIYSFYFALNIFSMCVVLVLFLKIYKKYQNKKGG